MYPDVKWTFLTIVVTSLMVEISLCGFHFKAAHLVSHLGASDFGTSSVAAPLFLERTGKSTQGDISKKQVPVLRQRSVILYCLTVFFIHVANAPVRNLVGQVLAIGDGRADLPLAAAALVVAEFAAIVGAWYYKPVWKKLGDRGMIYVGAGTVAVRSLMNFLLVQNMDVTTPAAKALLLSTQIFDGIGHGIWVTNQMSVMRTVGEGSGRFGFLSGLAHFCHMMGATCGQAIAGIVADASFQTAFLMCTFVPVLSCICITGVVMDSPWKDAAPGDVEEQAVTSTSVSKDSQTSQQEAVTSKTETKTEI
jgi:predicted MFS family arabinose efflux permease